MQFGVTLRNEYGVTVMAVRGQYSVSMGTSIRKVTNFARPSDDEPKDEESAPSSESDRKPRLGDRLQGTLEDVSVDSVKAVREIRERE